MLWSNYNIVQYRQILNLFCSIFFFFFCAVVMKLVRCEWAPSLVVEWLCGELEERGIPGPTYAHTLLSLLHHHYCPHPAPATTLCTATCSTNTVTTTASTRCYNHPLSRRHLDDFDLCDLDLDDLLGHTTHPDADLPHLSTFTQQQVNTAGHRCALVGPDN